MKTDKIIKSLALSLLVGLTSCEMEMNAPTLEVSVANSGVTKVVGDTVYVVKGSEVEFLFSGNPDNITYWSGELEHQYLNKDRIFIENKCKTSKLSWNAGRNWGPYGTLIQGLKMFYTTDKIDMEGKFKQDSTMIRKANWTELLDQNGKPADPMTRGAMFTYKEYQMSNIGKPFYIAFQIEYPKMVPGNADYGPTYYINNLQLDNVLSNGDNAVVKAITMGFKPLFMDYELYAPYYNTDKELGARPNLDAAYRSFSPYWTRNMKLDAKYKQYLWNVSNIGSAVPQIAFEAGNVTDFFKNNGYETWLISSEIDLDKTKVSPDKGVAVKSMYVRLSSYSYTYNKLGVYKGTFVPTSMTIQNTQSGNLIEFNIKVVDKLPN